MKEVLPEPELPAFFHALETMGANPRKSFRLRRDLLPESAAKWTPEKFREVGIPLGDPIPWYPHGYFFDLAKMKPHPSRHPVIAAGLGFIQEAGAMEVVPALEVRANDLVLDLCAAPGAKATHLGEYLGPKGWLVANEPVRDRAKVLEAILARHGIGNSTVFNLEPHRLAESFPETFDRVLVDAPCSGESLFAKRAEKRRDITHKEVERCALRQSAILKSAARMVAAGGRMVYSTCAFSRAENESVAEIFLATHPEFARLEERRRFPHRDGVPGGYFALFERRGGVEVDREVRIETLRNGVREVGSRGLVRDGLSRWDGNPDAYATLMDRKGNGANAFSAPIETENLDLDAVGALLSGSEKRARKFADERRVIYVWEGERIAGSSGETLYYPRGRLQ